MDKDKKRANRIWGWVFLAAFWSMGICWLVRIPPTGKGGVLLAVGATLMPLFWDKATKLGQMAWIAMLFLLLGVEYRAIDKDKVDSAAELTKHFNDISAQAQKNLQDTQQKAQLQTDNQNFLMIQVVAANNRLADLDRKVAAAKGNPQLIAELKAQAAAAQQQNDTAARNALLALSHNIVVDLDTINVQWRHDQTVTGGKFSPGQMTPLDVRASLERQKQEAIASLNRDYSEKVRPAMTIANDLRIQWLKSLPIEFQEDQNKAAVFVKSVNGGVITQEELRGVIGYLADLESRIRQLGSH